MRDVGLLRPEVTIRSSIIRRLSPVVSTGSWRGAAA